MNNILNIVVCYNNKDDILQYIKELGKQESHSIIWICIVINDDTQEKDFLKYAESNIHIVVVKATGNIGYMRGAIYGYKYFMKNYKIDLDWVIISNSDIEYKNNHFFVDLYRLNLSSDIVCIGPDTYVPDTGEYQNPALYERMKKIKLLAYMAIFSNSISGRLYLKLSDFRKKKAPRKKRNSSIVYMVHGSYWILKPEVMDSAVKKPYGALLYSEELYIAELVRELNKKMYYTDKLQVIHNEHVSTRHVKYKQKCQLLEQSYKYIYQTFF
jgi:GT2 family glycosyltransferase